ncbi:hypothetical protein SDC9_147665 [bioreactor metagenome]|uniref:Uncharacterized protein n=1 Tax=bioreactor metagenome TaxID=1076179 RepID=A0A645EGM7_9ZZZZ
MEISLRLIFLSVWEYLAPGMGGFRSILGSFLNSKLQKKKLLFGKLQVLFLGSLLEIPLQQQVRNQEEMHVQMQF